MERGQELNTEHAQMRPLLGRQKEQILAECQAEIKKHELQANYDRITIPRISGTIESQQEELHRAQVRIEEFPEIHLRHYCKTKIGR